MMGWEQMFLTVSDSSYGRCPKSSKSCSEVRSADTLRCTILGMRLAGGAASHAFSSRVVSTGLELGTSTAIKSMAYLAASSLSGFDCLDIMKAFSVITSQSRQPTSP